MIVRQKDSGQWQRRNVTAAKSAAGRFAIAPDPIRQRLAAQRVVPASWFVGARLRGILPRRPQPLVFGLGPVQCGEDGGGPRLVVAPDFHFPGYPDAIWEKPFGNRAMLLVAIG